ncbi:secreted protein [marine actinobacterium PHSC20C1]|nr:secreted protein [marine actinobacterium PHSC20C1]
MTGGDIAGLIAAGVFAILVGLLAVPLLKLGRVFDETSSAIRGVSDNLDPMLTEATATISETNRQLARVDAITRNVEETTGNVAALVALGAATVGGPLIKIAGLSAGVRAALLSIRPKRRR